MDNARTFTVRLAELLLNERLAQAEFLVALAEFDRRRLWTDLGHSSLFSYLHRELGLSKGAAFYRKAAVELLQRFPEIVEPLRDGRLCLTTVVELSKVLTPENREAVLPRFFHLSKSDAREVSAEIRPAAAPHRDVVTVSRTSAAAPALALTDPAPDPGHFAVHPANQSWSAPLGRDAVQPANRQAREESRSVTVPVTPRFAASEPANLPSPPSTKSCPVTVDPLTADASRLHVTVSRRFLKKLEAARAALSHSHPGAGAEEILEAGLDLVLERHAKRRGLVAKPRREPPPSKPEHVPAHVKRAVWERDAGRCQWKLDSGGICGSTLRVELDHRVAKARGGPPTVENLRCLCRVHNQLSAREVFGDAWMGRFARGAAVPQRPLDVSRSSGEDAAEVCSR